MSGLSSATSSAVTIPIEVAMRPSSPRVWRPTGPSWAAQFPGALVGRDRRSSTVVRSDAASSEDCAPREGFRFGSAAPPGVAPLGCAEPRTA